MSQATETILIVEDDTAVAAGLMHNLEYEGYHVLHAPTGEHGLRLALDEAPDLIVLDLMLPGIGGLDVLRAVRREKLDMQVIVLTARGREDDKIEGLRLGADDYVTKPFGLRELLARVEAALRRPRERRKLEEQIPLHFSNVTIDRGRREVFVGGQPCTTTAREFDLLVFMVTHPNHAFAREAILRKVWGYAYEGTTRTVDNFIRSLRMKLEEDPTHPRHLMTVHGVGYRFVS